MPKIKLNKILAAADRLSIVKLLIPIYICIAMLFAVLISRGSMPLLEPAGYIADIQSKILWGALIFALVVGVTILTAFFMVVSKFKESNHQKYEPEWKANKFVLSLGWGIPILAIAFISVLIWNTAHLVDAYRPIDSTTKAITIQVVALQWKWLFLYPNDHIGTVNTLEIPANTPINFELTADAPMNGFWIPQLSGQIAAMPGMVTQLHIEADKPGTYVGSPAEISGDDFADMTFTVNAVSGSDYNSWKAGVAKSQNVLDYTSYTQLARPSSDNAVAYYSIADSNLFHEIVMQFMAPGADQSTLNVRGANL